jgi:cob(I)alamin adenosyltransferase
VNRRARVLKIPFNKIIADIQKNLFVIGSNLAQPMIRSKSIPHPLHKHYAGRTMPGAAPVLPTITLEQVHEIEDMIDHFQKNLPPLTHFILPQGNPIASALQVTRAICRRTERRVVQLAMHAKVDPLNMAYLNRLSDLLFVLARAVNHKTKRGDIIWHIPKKR